MSSATPPHSLRNVDLRRPKRRLLRWLLFLPLTVLIVLVVLLALLGVGTKLEARQQAAEQREQMLTAGAQQESLPEACLAPSFEPLPADIWSGDRAAASDAVFAEHPEAAGMRVEGLNGFNFWGDAQASNFSQALGRGPWHDDQLAQWIAYFQDLDEQLSADGRQLLIAVAPAKWELYRENLPEWTADLQGRTHLDQFLERSGDLPVVDVRKAMAEAKEDAPVFSAVNSHWTPYGSFVAWEQMVDCGSELYPESVWADIEAPELVGIEAQEAPNEFAPMGDSTSPEDWTVPLLHPQSNQGVHSTVTGEDGAEREGRADGYVGLLEMPATTNSEDGTGTALILRDSTGEALSQIWSRSFAETCQIRHNLDTPASRPDVVAEAEACDAEVVLYVFAERHFSQQPPA